MAMFEQCGVSVQNRCAILCNDPQDATQLIWTHYDDGRVPSQTKKAYLTCRKRQRHRVKTAFALPKTAQYTRASVAQDYEENNEDKHSKLALLRGLESSQKI